MNVNYVEKSKEALNPMKDNYIALIQVKLSECDDVVWLDFIYKLLEKVEQQPPKIKANPYRQSKTMQLIGKQNIGKYISDDEIMRGLKDIANAKSNNAIDPFEAMLDCFLYGCITGKREIRAKKKATI